MDNPNLFKELSKESIDNNVIKLFQDNINERMIELLIDRNRKEDKAVIDFFRNFLGKEPNEDDLKKCTRVFASGNTNFYTVVYLGVPLFTIQYIAGYDGYSVILNTI